MPETPMDADGHGGGESGQAHSSAGRAHWDRANALQRQERAAERDHGRNSPEAAALHEQAAAERQAALDAGYQSDFQGRMNIDRRGGRR